MNESDNEFDLFSYAEAVREQEAAEAGKERAAVETVEEPEPAALPVEEPERAEVAPESPAAPPEPARVPPPKALTRSDFHQLCIGFLASLSPDAIATFVPVRQIKYQVTAAGFWLGGNPRNREVARTAAVVFFDQPDNCFCDCVDQKALLEAIHNLRDEKEKLEAEIRATEPELASANDLFSEFRSWDYASSRNPAYQKLRRKLEKLQHTLHQGSRLEHIRRAGAADLCYLAVPAGLIAPDEIAAGWGLVYLNADRSFTLVREAELQVGVDPRNRQLLARNIAVAATSAVLFAAGVEHCGENVRYRRVPRRRRPQ